MESPAGRRRGNTPNVASANRCHSPPSNSDERDGTEGWDGMGWNGMGWDRMGWDGMGWDGMMAADNQSGTIMPFS